MQISAHVGLLSSLDYDSKRWKEQFLGEEFQQTIESIQAISEIMEDRQLYDQPEKTQRDYEWAINVAREEGREEGLEQRMERGKLTGKIQTLQELLEERLSTDAEFVAMDGAQLQEKTEDFQSRLRNRNARVAATEGKRHPPLRRHSCGASSTERSLGKVHVTEFTELWCTE